MYFNDLNLDIKKVILALTINNNTSQISTLRRVCKQWKQLTKDEYDKYIFDLFIKKLNACRSQMKKEIDLNKGNLVLAAIANNQVWDEKIKTKFLPWLQSLANSFNPFAQLALFKAHCYPLYLIIKENKTNDDKIFEFIVPKEQQNSLLGYIYLSQAAQCKKISPLFDKLNTLLKDINIVTCDSVLKDFIENVMDTLNDPIKLKSLGCDADIVSFIKYIFNESKTNTSICQLKLS